MQYKPRKIPPKKFQKCIIDWMTWKITQKKKNALLIKPHEKWLKKWSFLVLEIKKIMMTFLFFLLNL